jgi:carboxylesterase type B
VPRTVWEKRNVGRSAPVLVWIYGGGYTAGSKWQFGSGAGLLKQAASPIIYVALNYRVSLAGSVSYFATSTNYLGKAGY